MQAIEPTRESEPSPTHGWNGLWSHVWPAVGLVALSLTLAFLVGQALCGLREAGRFAARSHADTQRSLDVAQDLRVALSGLRADYKHMKTASTAEERARLEASIEERRRSLGAELGRIGLDTSSVRVGQAAVLAQDAVSIWHAALHAEFGDRDRESELDRLAAGAETQLIRLTTATERYSFGLRKIAEEAVEAQIRLIEGLFGAVVALVPLLAWLVVLRSRRADGGSPHQDAGRDPRPSASIRLEDIVAPARDGVVVTNAERRIAYANAAAASLLGRSPQSLHLGAPAADILDLLSAREADDGSEIRLADGRWLLVGRSATPDGSVLYVLRDVSERRRRDAQAEATAAGLRTAIDAMSQGLCLYDSAHRLVVSNRRYAEIYGHEPGSLLPGTAAADVLARSITAGNHPGRTLSDLLGEAECVIAKREEGGHFQELAGERIIQIAADPTADGGFVATYDDVTERWHAESRIAYVARHDGLTDLANRMLLAERIEGAITQASRDAGFAVHCLDVDNFKQINDTLGHAVGDELLRAIAHRLTACLREVDTVARLGGDEFAIVQAGVATPQDAAVLARHLIDVIGAPYALTEHSVTIGVSIGIALAPADGMAPDRLLKNADVALYKAKGDGRGVFRFFEAEMDARLQARRQLEIDLRAAFAAEAFELHYQPIYDLAQDRIIGFEALLRWTHPTRGRISPAEFVPLAEEIGLIVPLGEWVLRKACAEASRWPDDLKIAVNVSPAQFQSAQLIHTVRHALAETKLAAGRLELEITESVLLADRGATVAILHTLRTLGARISMDDFGTGYSSLSYLRSFPFDKMKIDQSFVRDLTAENGSGFIVQAVISLGSKLGMTLTAEGVETEAQLAWLRKEGCDEVQGYLFSPPVPVSQIAGLLQKWNGAGAAARAA